MAMVDGSKLVKWLDVPDGPMASGEAAFVTGHLKRANAGQRDQLRACPEQASVPGFPLPDRERRAGRERQTQAWRGIPAFPAKIVPGWECARGNPATTPLSRFPAIPLSKERASIGNAHLPRSCSDIDEHGAH
jgi:hypothetical protein